MGVCCSITSLQGEDVVHDRIKTTMRNAPELGAIGPDAGGTEGPVGQIVLVLQGGGALGAFQAGVYHALSEGGLEPDWVIGTSIGAINGAIIAGNPAEARRHQLQDFWSRVGNGRLFDNAWTPAGISRAVAGAQTLAHGVPGFFQPNPILALNLRMQVGIERAAFYSTDPLKATLSELVDFEYINRRNLRFTVGAVNARTGEMRYFDCRDTRVGMEHVMASGALPPGFPAVRIEGEPYWDGGVYSNTPIEVVFDDNPRRDSLIFAVNMWHSRGAEPKSIWEVLGRQKDIQHASRVDSHIARQEQIHRLRHVVRELAMRIPADQADREVQQLAQFGCHTTLHVVRLLAPQVDHEDHTKDIDFTHSAIRTRWQAGYERTQRVLREKPWRRELDPLQCVAVH
jgi:NTE family protein